MSQFRIQVDPTERDGATVLVLGRADEACVITGVAWHEQGESQAWHRVKSLYLAWTDRDPLRSDVLPKKPTALPWTATLLLPWILNQPGDLIEHVHTLCILLAYAILEENGVIDRKLEHWNQTDWPAGTNASSLPRHAHASTPFPACRWSLRCFAIALVPD